MHMELDVRRPVFVGDTVYATVEILESRAASSGNRGVVKSTVRVFNQRDEEVLVFHPIRLIRGREGASA
jgi:acyl dehydratase